MDTPRMKTRSVSRREGTPVSSVVTVEVKTSTGKRGRPSKSEGSKKLSYTIRADGTSKSPIVLVLGGADQNQPMIMPQVLNSRQPQIAKPTPPTSKQGVYHMIYSDDDDSDVSSSSSPDHTLEMLQNKLEKLQNMIANYRPKKRKRRRDGPKRLRLDSLQPSVNWNDDVDSFLNSDDFLQEFSENWGETVNNEAVTSDSGLGVPSVDNLTLLENNPSRCSDSQTNEVEDDDDLPLAQVLRKTGPSQLTQSEHSLSDRILKEIQEEIDNEVNDSPDDVPQAGAGMEAASENSDSHSWRSDVSDEAQLIRERMKQSWRKVNNLLSSEEAAVAVNQLQGRVLKNSGKLLNKSGQTIDETGAKSSNFSSVDVEFHSTDDESNDVFKLPDLPNSDEPGVPNAEQQIDSNEIIFRSLDIFKTPEFPEKERNESRNEIVSSSPDSESNTVYPLLPENITINWEDIPEDSSSSDDEDVCILPLKRYSKPPPEEESSEDSSISDDDRVLTVNETRGKETCVVLASSSSSSDDEEYSAALPIPVSTIDTSKLENSKVSSSFHVIDAVDTSDDDESAVGNVPALAPTCSSSRPQGNLKKEVKVTKQPCKRQEDFCQSNGAKVSCGSSARRLFRDENNIFSCCDVDNVPAVDSMKIATPVLTNNGGEDSSRSKDQNRSRKEKAVSENLPILKLRRVKFSPSQITTVLPAQGMGSISEVKDREVEVETKEVKKSSSICDRTDASKPSSPAKTSSTPDSKEEVTKQPCKRQEDSALFRDGDNSLSSCGVGDIPTVKPTKIASPVSGNNCDQDCPRSKDQNLSIKEVAASENLPMLKLHRVKFSSAIPSSSKIRTVPLDKGSSSEVEAIHTETSTPTSLELNTALICDRVDTLKPSDTSSSISDSKDVDARQIKDREKEVPKKTSPAKPSDLPSDKPPTDAVAFRNDEEDVAKLVSPASSISENESQVATVKLHNLDEILNTRQPNATISTNLQGENSNCSRCDEQTDSAEKITSLPKNDSDEEEDIEEEPLYSIILKDEPLDSFSDDDDADDQLPKIAVQFLPKNEYWCSSYDQALHSSAPPFITHEENDSEDSFSDVSISSLHNHVPKIDSKTSKNLCIRKIDYSDASDDEEITTIPRDCETISLEWPRKIEISDSSDEDVDEVGADKPSIQQKLNMGDEVISATKDDPELSLVAEQDILPEVTEKLTTRRRTRNTPLDVDESPEKIPTKQVKKKLTKKNVGEEIEGLDSPKKVSPVDTDENRAVMEETETEVLKSPTKVNIADTNGNLGIVEIEPEILKSPKMAKQRKSKKFEVEIDAVDSSVLIKTEENELGDGIKIEPSKKAKKKKIDKENNDEIKVEPETEVSAEKNVQEEENPDEIEFEPQTLKSRKNLKIGKGKERTIKRKVMKSPEKVKKIKLSDNQGRENQEEVALNQSENDEIARLPEHFLKDLAAVKKPKPKTKVKKMKMQRELLREDKVATVNHGSTEFSARVAVNSAGREQLAGDFKQRLLYGSHVRRAPSQSLKVIAMKQRF